MPIRQVQVIGCDVCRVEAVHTQNNPATSKTTGWLGLNKTQLVVYGTSRSPEVTGYFCSVTCLVQYFRKLTEGTGANISPVDYVDGEGQTE